MIIRTRIIYHVIYVPVPGSSLPPRRRLVPPNPAMEAAKKELKALQNVHKDPVTQRKLTELAYVVDSISHQIDMCHAPGIVRMLLQLVSQIQSLAAGGQLDAALNLAGQTLDLAKNCNTIVAHILKMIGQLKFSLAVEGPAARLLMDIAGMAERALNSATSPQALLQIEGLLEKAVSIGHKMEGLSPQSEEYQLLMQELAGILGQLKAMVGPEFEKDRSSVPVEIRDIALNGIDQLKGQTRDVFKLKQLEQLERSLEKAIALAVDLPPAAQAALREKVVEILKQAAGGDLVGALGAAKELGERVDQMVKLNGHLDQHLDRLVGLVDGLNGPAKDMMGGVVQKLEALKDGAASPEDLKDLDALMVKARELGDKLRALPAGSQMRSPEYTQLLALDRQIAEKLASRAPASPGLGRDSYGSGSPGAAGSGGAGGVGGASPGAPGYGQADPQHHHRHGPRQHQHHHQPPVSPTIAAGQHKLGKQLDELGATAKHTSGANAQAIHDFVGRCHKGLQKCKDEIDLAAMVAAIELGKVRCQKVVEASPGSSGAKEACKALDEVLPEYAKTTTKVAREKIKVQLPPAPEKLEAGKAHEGYGHGHKPKLDPPGKVEKAKDPGDDLPTPRQPQPVSPNAGLGETTKAPIGKAKDLGDDIPWVKIPEEPVKKLGNDDPPPVDPLSKPPVLQEDPAKLQIGVEPVADLGDDLPNARPKPKTADDPPPSSITKQPKAEGEEKLIDRGDDRHVQDDASEQVKALIAALEHKASASSDPDVTTLVMAIVAEARKQHQGGLREGAREAQVKLLADADRLAGELSSQGAASKQLLLAQLERLAQQQAPAPAGR